MKNITILRLNKILRKTAGLTALVCVISALCGCSGSFSAGDMLASPRLTDEQNEIYNALTASAGRVDLRYPHTGEYRSAFVIHNIDGEPTDEAIVFYEQNKTEAAKEPNLQEGNAVGNLRVSFLDKDENGNWKATYELPAAGTEVDSVAFSKLGSDKEKLLISYSVLGSSDKIMSVIDYENGVATQLGTIGYSSYMMLDNLNESGEYLACFNRDSAQKSGNMTVYGCTDGKTLGMIYPVLSFGSGVTEFDKITSAYCLLLGKEMPCIAVDYLISENYYGTSVLFYNGSSFATADTVVRDGANTNYSRRVNSYTPKLRSQDIDGDGVIDIPATSPLPGYENLSYPEQICAVRWYKQNCNKIELTAYTFVDPQRNYMLTFPGRWIGMVTATINTADNSVTFWKHEGDIKENEYALLTIKVVLKSDTSSQSEPDVQSALRDGFKMFSDDSEKTIYYKSIMYEGLSLTEDEIAAAIKVRPEGYENDTALMSRGN